jgi:hypothetical protein
MMYCTCAGWVEKVAGHSAASSEGFFDGRADLGVFGVDDARDLKGALGVEALGCFVGPLRGQRADALRVSLRSSFLCLLFHSHDRHGISVLRHTAF